MARQQERQLYKELMSSKFSFIKRGVRSINDVYNAVKAQYPSLCDDSYYCSENCRSGNNQPEWNHTIRNALQQNKSINGPVSYTGRKRYWEFR